MSGKMTLKTYVISRILLTIPMIFILLTTVFVVVRVLPGDPVQMHFEKMASPETVDRVRTLLGLNKPIYLQYLDYLVGVFSGNLGKSMQDYSLVADQVFSAFPATLELAVFATLIAVLVGVFLGVESSKSYNKPKDHVIRVFGIVTYAVPVFFLGMILQMVFGVWLHWLPTGGRMPTGLAPTGMNVPLSPSSGFSAYFLVPSFVGLALAGICLVLAKMRRKPIERRLWTRAVILFVVGFAMFAGLGWYFVSAGRVHLSTGLYTVDSLLEGNPFKFGLSLKYLFLPSLTLGVVLCGIFIRLTRTNMFDTMRLDFVTAAKARGLKDRTVTYRYALRNAFLPVLTMMGLEFALLLAGAVLTETTFSWPGLGRYIFERISFRDYTAIQGAVVVFGLFVSIVSLAVDLLYAYLDPRIRL
jgi:ABC-type dipeptide/oligopeptide/nickel transport system permease component